MISKVTGKSVTLKRILSVLLYVVHKVVKCVGKYMTQETKRPTIFLVFSVCDV